MTTTPHDLAKLNCDQLRGRLDSLRPDIDRNGPETLRELLAQVDALLARQTGWSACKRAARYRNILDIYYASRSALPVPVGSGSESVPPLDLVVPLGDGSMHDDLELRFLLRSALSCLPRLRRVHIIGPRRPEWLREHDRLRFHAWSQTRPKNHDIVAKFIHAAHHPAVSETFVGTCDDFLFLSRCPADYGAVATRGVLSTSRDRGAWKRAQADTRKVLEQAGLPVVYYDYHVPTVMTKSGWRKVNASVQWKSVPGHAVWSLYHNTAGVHGEVRSGTYASYHAADGSKTPQSTEEIERDTADKLFLCYNDGGLKNGVLEGWLATRFPTPAPWEGDSPRSHEEHEERQEANGEGESGKVDLPAGVGLGESGQSGASSSRYPDDLDILVVLYGRNPHRAQAVAKTFANWHKYQRPMPRVLCAWCYRDGEAPGELATIPDYPWLQRVPLPQYDLDDGVFRKEGLLNHLLKEHATAPHILTLDADVWSPRNGWFQSIRDKLAESPDHVLQPFMYFRDTKEKTGAWSWSAQTLDGVDPKRCKHPGLGWAFTRAWADKHGDQPVFNPWCITGSGDCAFMVEHFAAAGSTWSALRHEGYAYFRRIRRKGLPVAKLAAVEARVWHECHTDRSKVPDHWHGRKLCDRAYVWSRRWLDMIGPLTDHIRLDSKGIAVPWNADGPFVRTARRKPEMQDEKATRAVMDREFGHYLWPQTRDEYRAVCRTDDYYSETDRWTHCYVPILDALSRLHLSETRLGILEVGPRRFPLTHHTDRMDMIDYGLPRTTLHNAADAPWPFADQSYSVVIMSHVLEHLGDRQALALREASRVANILLLAIPYRWRKYERNHRDLTEDTLANWLHGTAGTLDGSWITGASGWRQLLWQWRVR